VIIALFICDLKLSICHVKRWPSGLNRSTKHVVRSCLASRPWVRIPRQELKSKCNILLFFSLSILFKIYHYCWLLKYVYKKRLVFFNDQNMFPSIRDWLVIAPPPICMLPICIIIRIEELYTYLFELDHDCHKRNYQLSTGVYRRIYYGWKNGCMTLNCNTHRVVFVRFAKVHVM